jgi:predicted nuclease of predicted toxin-antitoxin system
MRLLLDAHFDPVVAHTLGERGHDVASVLDLGPEVYQASDAELLAFAGTARRAFVTRNIRDFVLLHARWVGREQAHAGIVLIHAETISEGDRGAEIHALENLLRLHPGPDDLADTVVWLGTLD